LEASNEPRVSPNVCCCVVGADKAFRHHPSMTTEPPVASDHRL
jgi:hypothetical protein